ncbi:MAG: HEAT repeat domain-containing protein, partial [Deltaproteobacteria bacterium]|nr:HEAT repeat domain-containing protein [Deltaproteobacteria bacterium]
RAGPDEVAGFLVQLSGTDSAQRTTVAQKLSKIDNDPRLLRPFARLLLDKELRAFALTWFKKVGKRAIGASPWVGALARGKVHPRLGVMRDKPDGTSRQMAIKVLGHVGGPRACDTLVELLEDPAGAISQAARHTVKKLGAECLPSMLPLLARPSKHWARAINIVANWKPRPLDAFLKALETPLVEARRGLISVLLSDLRSRVTIALLGQLKHPHWRIRTQALKSLGHPRRKLTAAQLATIRTMLTDPNVDVLAQAAKVLSDRKDRLAEALLLKLYQWRPAKVPGYGHSESWRMADMHSRVAEALIAIKSEKGFQAVLARLSAKPGHGHYAALGRSKDRRALEPLLVALKRVKHGHSVEQILEALGELGFVEARAALERRLEHKKMRVRWAAVRALKTLGDAKAVPALLRRLKDRECQTFALEALERYAGPAVVPRLCRLLRKPKTLASTLETVVRILGKSKSPQATGCLLTALGLYEKDKRFQYNYVLTCRIVEVLGKTADERGIDALIRRLKRPTTRPTPKTRRGGAVMAPRVQNPVVIALGQLAKRYPASAGKIGRALKEKGH